MSSPLLIRTGDNSLKRWVESTANTSEQVGEKSDLVFRNTLQAADGLIQTPNFHAFSSRDLRILYQQIDDQFFGQRVANSLSQVGSSLHFRVSRRMTSSAGTTTTRFNRGTSQPGQIEIAISASVLFESFQNEESLVVAGLSCANRLQALCRVMEHEMLHMIEILIWNRSSCGAPRFQDMAHRLFGHRQSSHRLITPRENAARKFDIVPGDWVSFQFENQTLRGIVNRITRRATVLVPSVRGAVFTDGQRYLKYYVPVALLCKLPPR